METKRAVVLLSGGLDSATALAIAKAEGFELFALSFRYGQRHEIELDAAQRVALSQGVRLYQVMPLDLRIFGGSALTSGIPVPKHQSIEDISDDIPVTYVPARNTIFLSLALAWAEVLGAWDIFIGVNAVDYSGYPDCRPEYVSAFENLANLATKAATERRGQLRIHTPLLSMSKAEIIQRGLELGVDYSLTRSCYDPTPLGESCGSCDSCLIRQNGFATNNLVDPVPYARTPTEMFVASE